MSGFSFKPASQATSGFSFSTASSAGTVAKSVSEESGLLSRTAKTKSSATCSSAGTQGDILFNTMGTHSNTTASIDSTPGGSNIATNLFGMNKAFTFGSNVAVAKSNSTISFTKPQSVSNLGSKVGDVSESSGYNTSISTITTSSDSFTTTASSSAINMSNFPTKVTSNKLTFPTNGATAQQISLSTTKVSSTMMGTTPSVTTATVSLGSSINTILLKQMSYKELEDAVEKWHHDLGEQEKAFLNQASQVNVWDKLLIENGEKVTELHNEVGKVKAEQKRLDCELDFILSQQEELEELLRPIENQLKTQQAFIHCQYNDVERDRTFRLAEDVDSQLKIMMQDLKETIDCINKSHAVPSKTVDETMNQVAKILNAHMDSLQWIDQNANWLQQRIKEVSQLVSVRKHDYDRTFHLTYD